MAHPAPRGGPEPLGGRDDTPPELFTPAEIRAQLHRIAESRFFRGSKRCRLFLERVVEHSLSDTPEPLKERTLGVHVFAREETYDTAADPVVRVTAGEVRRRLGQYYAEGAHHGQLRIDLPSGSYGPTYARPSSSVAVPQEPAWAAPGLRRRGPLSRRWVVAIPAITLAVGLAAWGLTRPRAGGNAFDTFWAPFLEAPVPVLVCAGGLDMYELPWDLKAAANDATAAAAGVPLTVSPGDVQRIGARYVAVSDAVAIARVAALFQQRGRPHIIRENSATSFADLRESPVVLVGMFSNDWFLQLGAQSRFLPIIEGDGHHVGIHDRQRPEQPWRLPRPWPSLNVTRDYALVSRVFDPTTATPVVSAGGITPFGTAAAVEFLTTPAYLEQALSAVGGWSGRNLQIVLEAEVIDGAAGAPRVLAVHVW